MSDDARFEDAAGGQDVPLRLIAQDHEDLQVISSLVQDAIFAPQDIQWSAQRRELALLTNRFRWERGDRPGTSQDRMPPERVRTLLLIRDVTRVSSQGFERKDPDLILSLLSVTFEPESDGSGAVVLTLAGDGAVRCLVECLDVTLRDVTRPYLAPSRRTPEHPE